MSTNNCVSALAEAGEPCEYVRLCGLSRTNRETCVVARGRAVALAGVARAGVCVLGRRAFVLFRARSNVCIETMWGCAT